MLPIKVKKALTNLINKNGEKIEKEYSQQRMSKEEIRLLEKLVEKNEKEKNKR